MSLLSAADSFMCSEKDQNETVSVGEVMDKTTRARSTMHSESLIDLTADISLLAHFYGTSGTIKYSCTVAFASFFF